MNLKIYYQIANICDWFGQIGSPKNAFLKCVIALYFCPLVLGHPVQLNEQGLNEKKGQH